jgi:hypothetical protein
MLDDRQAVVVGDRSYTPHVLRGSFG